ncbi:hypothetical protein LSTR_LSTR015926 [Laodelphax striatellus]|uniref:Uncharacterized protein n=1 Tax=Laodelphax striatellus TaxID=195883 RepID=A0A482X9P1_LAOST|nr:hypothetical protein LSTR_LSTR015926 [Laodelphax striatellus]
MCHHDNLASPQSVDRLSALTYQLPRQQPVSALIRLANQPPERVKTCNTYKWGQIDAMHLMQPGTEGSMKVPLIYNLIYGVQTSDSKRDIEQMRIEFQKNIDDIVKIKDG